MRPAFSKNLTVTAAGIIAMALLLPPPLALAREGLPEEITTCLDGHLSEEYPDEDYVYLVRENHVVLHSDGSYDITYHRAVQLLTAEGVDDKKKIWMTTNAFFSTVDVRFARTVNGAEEIVYTEESDIIEQLLEGGYMKGHYRKRKTTIPFSELRIGSVIEYEYTVSTSADFTKGEAWFDWAIQFEYPVLEARTTFQVPEGRAFFTHAVGDIHTNEHRENGSDTSTIIFSAKDVPALTDEVYPPSNRERAARVMASTLETWDDFARWFVPIFDEACTISDEQWKEYIKDWKYNIRYDGDLLAAYTYVRNKIEYSLGLWATGVHIRPGHEVVDFGGERKAHAALLIAMLRRNGIEAFPALLSTKTLSIVPEIVNPGQFDRLMVHVPGRGYIDPTISTKYRNDPLPEYLDKPVYILRADGAEAAVTSPIDFPGYYTLLQTVDIHPDGTILVEDQHLFRENYAANMRRRMGRIPGSNKIKRVQVREYLEEHWAHGDLLDWEYHRLRDAQGPFKLYVKYESGMYTSWANDLLVMKLPIHPSATCTDLLEEFKERTTAVDIDPLHYQYNCTIPIPPRFMLGVLPPEVDIANEVGKFKSKFFLSGNNIKYQGEIEINKRRIPVDQYPMLRELLEAQHAAFHKQIVFQH